MGLTPLAKVSIVLPRADLAESVKKLSQLGWFHVSPHSDSNHDPRLSELSGRAYKLYAELTELIQALGIREAPPISDQILRGAEITRTKLKAKSWEDLVEKLEESSQLLIVRTREALEQRKTLEKSYADSLILASGLNLISNLSINLADVSTLRRHKVVFAVTSAKDVEEIRNSLPGVFVFSRVLGRGAAVILIVGSSSDSERIERVLRTFELKKFTIPSGLPQNPKQAFEVVQREVASIRENLGRLEEEITEIASDERGRLLSTREAASVAFSVLDQTRRAGPLRRFATIEGYVPQHLLTELRRRIAERWLLLSEKLEESHEGVREEVPIIMRNNPYTKSYEVITLQQGPPRQGELDPTLLISIAFPVFYGMMFGDLGHGLVLLAFGALLVTKGSSNLRGWGRIFASAGIGAMAMGILVGEAFGFALEGLIPGMGSPVFELVERAHGEATFNTQTVVALLRVAILVGMIHLGLGFALDTVKGIMNKEHVETLTVKLPTLVMYPSFIYAFSPTILSILDPTPLIGVPAANRSILGLSVFLAASFVLVVGKGLAAALGKPHRASLKGVVGMSLMGLIELLMRFIEFLANTISYTRLSILLLVHASLLLVLNKAQGLPLPVAAPILLIFNVLIILLEGLIVYIQDLRLHVYEWFTKFYEGTGQLFRKLVPETSFVEIELE